MVVAVSVGGAWLCSLTADMDVTWIFFGASPIGSGANQGLVLCSLVPNPCGGVAARVRSPGPTESTRSPCDQCCANQRIQREAAERKSAGPRCRTRLIVACSRVSVDAWWFGDVGRLKPRWRTRLSESGEVANSATSQDGEESDTCSALRLSVGPSRLWR